MAEFKTICGLCHTGCGLLVNIENGVIKSLRGDPEHPANNGRLCPKGAASIELVYSKDRLTHPLRKTKGGFKKISWEEAIDFASDNIAQIIEKRGPEGLIRFAGAPVSYDGRDSFMQFMASIGSPNFAGVGHLCHVPRITALKSVFGSPPEPDYASTKMILFWGTNPMGSTRYGNYAIEGDLGDFRTLIKEAKKNNIKVITIDPVCSETARLSDTWIPINPGTDMALALSMIHVIIYEDIYDKEFIENWTIGFDRLKEHVVSNTPEWAEGITGISATEIRKLAREYALTKPAILREGNGLDMNTSGVQTVRAMMYLIALTGNYDIPGGNVLFPWARQSFLPDFRKIKFKTKRLGQDAFPLFPEMPGPFLLDTLLANERKFGMIVTHSNPALVMADSGKTKRAFEQLSFLMVLDMFQTATSQMADLVLPSPSLFESYGYRAYSSRDGGFISLKPKVIEPLGESRHFSAIEYQIAEKLGVAKDYPFKNDKEWVDFMLRPTGLTIDSFVGKSVVFATDSITFRKYEKIGFKTPSKKVEFYSEVYAKHGQDPLPVYNEPLPLEDWKGENREKYPLKGTTRKQYEYVHTKFRNLECLKKIYPEPLVMIHPQNATDYRVEDGDMVKIESPRGQAVMKVKIADDFQQGLIVLDFGWGNPLDTPQTSANALTSGDVWDPISGSTANRLFYCNIRKV